MESVFEIIAPEKRKTLMRITTVSTLIDRNPNSPSYRDSFQTKRESLVMDMDRIRAPYDGVSKPTIVPPEADFDATSQLIRLKDENGKVLNEL